MKLIVSYLLLLAATTVIATAQITGFTNNLVAGIKDIGTLVPSPSIYGLVGAFALVGVISARRIRVSQ